MIHPVAIFWREQFFAIRVARTSRQQQAPEPISEDAQEPHEENFVPVESGDRAKQAKDAIQDLDTKEGEEELEIMSGREKLIIFEKI